uniref:(California timema) hypothetical protein n=1 Tax=Timema californicum TaxID=61474 RepID=A0A7R9JCK0_TIMCA|nr:unnamed protein product [Timema californicum]
MKGPVLQISVESRPRELRNGFHCKTHRIHTTDFINERSQVDIFPANIRNHSATLEITALSFHERLILLNLTSIGDGDGGISDESSSSFIMLCPCEESLCVRKCCSPEKILSFSSNQTKCIEHHQNNSEEWKPDFGEGSSNLTYVTVYGSNICKPDQGIYVLNPNSEEPHKEFYILENGQVRIKENAMLKIGKYEYCIDVSQYSDGSLTSNLLSCTERQITLRTFYSTLSLVGAFFLALTLLLLILTRMRGCHAMNIMSHTASLLVAYLALAVGHLDTNMSLAGCLANECAVSGIGHSSRDVPAILPVRVREHRVSTTV